ncbi:hypothetical protein LXL04_016445 [Taraxacum kok-saghyz]
MVPCKWSHDDDDDFVRTPPPQSTIAVQVSYASFPCVNTRFPTDRLIHTLQLSNDQQKTCVEAIGFGSSLTIRLGKPSLMLSYWLVDRTRLTHVIEKIVTDSKAGPLFILNFLVLYVSVMIGFPSMGTVNQSFLENIKMDVDVNRLDWCGFVMTCLNSARATWNRLDDKCVFTGPLGFVLELVQMVNQTFNAYYQAKEDLDVLLETSLNNYPGSEDDNKGNAENAGYNNAIVCTPLTQLLTTELFDMLEESALKSRGIQLKNDSDEDTNQDVHSPPRRRSKRCINLTDKLRSLNFVRIIDPNSGLKSIEERVSGMIFAGIGNECILNHEEQRINKDSPSRLFVSCILLANYVFDEQIGIEKRYHMFYKRMNEYLIKYQQHINFQQIDLVSELHF